jgi:hypothetical protein
MQWVGRGSGHVCSLEVDHTSSDASDPRASSHSAKCHHPAFRHCHIYSRVVENVVSYMYVQPPSKVFKPSPAQRAILFSFFTSSSSTIRSYLLINPTPKRYQVSPPHSSPSPLQHTTPTTPHCPQLCCAPGGAKAPRGSTKSIITVHHHQIIHHHGP